MAEDATYLNVATSQANRPTIFELISQEGMQQCLRPAIQLMCQHLTQIQPELFTKFYDYFDELYLLFDLFLESHYIWTHSASFGEHFYGLKRVNCLSIIDTFLNLNREAKNREKLSLRNKIYSLIALCVLPYLLSKSHTYFLSLQEKDWDYEIMSKKEEIIFKLYPCLDALTQISSLIFKFLYLTKRTDFYSFFYVLQSLKLVRETDSSMLETNFPYFAELRQRSLFLNLVLSPLGAANLIGYGFTHLLPFGIFLVKFLRHWYSQHGLGILELYNRFVLIHLFISRLFVYSFVYITYFTPLDYQHLLLLPNSTNQIPPIVQSATKSATFHPLSR